MLHIPNCYAPHFCCSSQGCIEGTFYIEILNENMEPLITQNFFFSHCSSWDLTWGRWRNCVGGSAALMSKIWRNLFSQSEIEPPLPFKSFYRFIRMLSIGLAFTKLSALPRINCTVCVSWCVWVLWSLSRCDFIFASVFTFMKRVRWWWYRCPRFSCHSNTAAPAWNPSRTERRWVLGHFSWGNTNKHLQTHKYIWIQRL